MPPGSADTPADDHGRDFEAGELLFREGDPGQHLYVIQRGAVRLSKVLRGFDVTVAELGDGDFVGEVGLMCDVHSATATAVEPTRCLLVDGPTLEDMVVHDAEIGVRMVRGLTQRLAACHRQLDLLGRPPDTRVALAIARYAEIEGEAEPDGVFVTRRLRDVGDGLAVGEAELAVVSKTLIRERLIRIKRNGILVPDVRRMYDFVRAADAAVESRSDDG